MMPKYTPNLNLYKPMRGDDIEVDQSLSDNFVKIDTEVKNVTSQLAQTTHDLEGRGINALFPPAPFVSAKGDGVTDDANAINTLLQIFDVVYLPPNLTYNATETIEVPRGKTLYSVGGKATIRLLTTNIPAVTLIHLSKLDGVEVRLPPGNNSDLSCGVQLLLSSESTRAKIDNFSVIGADHTSNGIYITGNSGTLTFTTINDVYFERVNNAFKADVVASATAYANGILGNNIVIRSSVRGFWLVGSEGNIFSNIEWNTGSRSKEVFYCETNFNKFSGWFWDLSHGEIPNVLATFNGNSTGNIIHTPSKIDSWKIIDNTNNKLNYINISNADVLDLVNMASHLPSVNLTSNDSRKWGRWFSKKPYGGHQENVLAFADKINNVVNIGKNLSSGLLANMFDPFAGISAGKPTWNLHSGEQIELEIDLLSPTFSTKRLDFVQVVFSVGLEGGYVKIEGFNGSTWITLKEETANDKRFVVFHDEMSALVMGSSIVKLRFTIKNPLNAGNDIRIEALTARMLATAGYTFLPRNGGRIYGNLEFSGTDGTILQSPDGSRWKQSINNNGVTSWVKI